LDMRKRVLIRIDTFTFQCASGKRSFLVVQRHNIS
jgi:hypothetical protein